MDSRTPDRRRIVVDGSNIATEGRTLPSLAQLNEAIETFLEEYRGFTAEDVTVVVDASFGHRIDPAEVKSFEDAIEHGEMVTPPAGAVGRGDGFILRIAEKSGALVLSNDSFQEFHAERPWLFEPGRLIGGKPVPGVGWVFTPRTPVRGPRSRSVTAKSKRESKASDEAVDVSDGARGVEGGETDGVDAAVKSRRSRRRRGSRGSGGSPVAETTTAPAEDEFAGAVEVEEPTVLPASDTVDVDDAYEDVGRRSSAAAKKATKAAKVGKATKATKAVKATKATKATKTTKATKAAKATKATTATKATAAVKATEATKATKATKSTQATKATPATKTTKAVKAAVPVTQVAMPTKATKTTKKAAPVTGVEPAPPSPEPKGRDLPVGEALNDGMTFITFVAEHPIGSTFEGEVVSFTSHGAHVDVGGMLCHVPLRNLGDPPPQKARSVLAKGETRTFELVSLDAPRRRAEIALPGFGA